MSDHDGSGYLRPEDKTRALLIDRQLQQSGWAVQNAKEFDPTAAQGIALREIRLAPGHGQVDYLLYVDRRAVGIIEAKREGTALTEVEWQSTRYADGLPTWHKPKAKTVDGRLPFVFEASGHETRFTNGYDPEPRSRFIFRFPRPSTLARILRDAGAEPDFPKAERDPITWRGKVRHLPPLDETGLRGAQIEAINGVERSLAEQRFDRSLVQMATGAGKTRAAIELTYRLLRHGGFHRVLFLVDRNNLAEQAIGAFLDFTTPDDGRLFPELFPVNTLNRAGLLDSTTVAVSTIQRVHKVLNGGEAPDGDDQQLDTYTPDDPVQLQYNPTLPPEAFDLVIIDEAHRSIYNSWRPIFDYFDAHVVGLTATPGPQTFAFFRGNLVSEYTYRQSVTDKVNVDFDIYRIRTEVTEQGGLLPMQTVVPTIDLRTRATRYEKLEEDFEYSAKQLDKAVTNPSQIRLVLDTFREHLFSEIFPGRSVVPKTLIYCKTDAHAEQVVNLVRQVFGKGNNFAAKITYQAKDARQRLREFRNSASPRVAVTVDMIATGTDVPPIECVFFLRDVRSPRYFEQMKGRGSRTIDPTDFQAVTPDAKQKDRFVIVDAIGVTEHDFVEPPINRVKGISLEQLLKKVPTFALTDEEASTLTSRLLALESDLTPQERDELDQVAGSSFRAIVRGLATATDPDRQAEALQAAPPGTTPEEIVSQLLETALEPLAGNPPLRERILDLRRTHDQIIDEVNSDKLIEAYRVVDPERAKETVASWKQYITEHQDTITALRLMDEAKSRRIPFTAIKEIAERIARPPHNWTVDIVWLAYEQVEKGRVRRSSGGQLTDLVSLLRFSLGIDQELVPYAERVQERYAGWLLRQEQAGVVFSADQRWWLDRMAEIVASSAGIDLDDLDEAPFIDNGGVDGAIRDLGDHVEQLVEKLNEELTA